MEIKQNQTRISLWNKGSRFAKIELNKLFITNGYSRDDRELWEKFKFNTIEGCLDILQPYLSIMDIDLSLQQIEYIKGLYLSL